MSVPIASSDVLRDVALRVRRHVLAIGAGPEGTHVGGSLSAVEILVTLFFHELRIRPSDPDWPDRDFFVLSKGHASAGLYGALAERGFIDREELGTYGLYGGRLAGHPLRAVPGVEFPTGSLGHGLSLGVGVALGAKRTGRPNRAFVLLGDGELQEGSVWEAVMAAPHFELDNLVAIVDRNGWQISGTTEECVRLEPLADRWASFGWNVLSVDGHDPDALVGAYASAQATRGKPTVIVARTLKGRGVRFFEDRKKSHYVTLSPQLYERALASLRGSAGAAA